MEDPDWAKVLSYLYRENSEIYPSTSEKYDIAGKTDHPPIEEVLDRTELTQEEIIDVLDEMDSVGIVNQEDRYVNTSGSKVRYSIYTLSKKGFDVAHDREMDERQTRVNIGIALLTVFLMVGSMLQAYSAFLNSDTGNQFLLAILLVIMAVLGMIVMGFITGLAPREIIQEIRESIGS